MKKLQEFRTYRVQAYGNGGLTHSFTVAAWNAREAETLVAELIERTGQKTPERVGAMILSKKIHIPVEVEE